jgi:beta-glucosidase
VAVKIASVVAKLTLEEKASLCLGGDFWHTRSIERLGIPAIMMTDGPHGLRKEIETPGGSPSTVAATCFPTASALGSSWDVSLVQRVGSALGLEARANKVGLVLGPGINIKRAPLCGRNFEYFSEDPLLSGVLGSALVRGIQSQAVGACVKHFAANNQETDRLRVSADIDERPLREIYLAAFEQVVTNDPPWAVMCAYNKVNGTFASEHRELLTEVLRDQWGFSGLVVSDWGAVHDRVAALAAGLDLEMPPDLGVSDAQIVAAVRAGALDESLVDAAAARVMTMVDRALPGLAADASFDVDLHHGLARTAAQDCAVLLKNTDGILPLQPVAGATLAVIGEFARTPRFQGAGSSQVNPTRVDVALEHIRAAVGPEVNVAFAPGFVVEPLSGISDLSGRSGLSGVSGLSGLSEFREGETLRAEAVALALDADGVVLFLGLPAGDESEGFDRCHLDLPANQVALLREVAAVNAEIVVVLANGGAVRVDEWDRLAKAVLECWLSGQASGAAVADLLLGHAEPSGRLAETLPRRLEDCPSFLNFPGDSGHVRYGEGIFVGYRGFDARDLDVSYPFGHGLSYTTFDYTDLAIVVDGRHDDGDLNISVSCQVSNTGHRTGREVVQVYVHDVEASVARPPQELKGFTKVALGVGEVATLSWHLGSRDLSYWSVVVHDWVLEGGEFEIAVGASSRDLRLRATVCVDAASTGAPLGPMSTLHEWLADPSGSAALGAAMGHGGSGKPKGVLGDPELLKMIGSFPISTLAAFPGIGLDHATLDALVTHVQRPVEGPSNSG